MAKWVRVHVNSSSDVYTNAYVDLTQYGYVRVEFDTASQVWHILASTVDNTQTATLFGDWITEELASKALYALLEGADLSQF
jgi:hypothetical protein